MATENKKISAFDEITSLQPGDFIPVVRTTGSTKSNYKITIKNALDSLSSNTSIEANFVVDGDTTITGDSLTIDTDSATAVKLAIQNLTVSSNGFVISTKYTPPSSTFVESSAGKLSWDDNYLYIRVANNSIKRVALSSF